MSHIANCPDHGYYKGTQCPDCGEIGEQFMTNDEAKSVSGMLTHMLRHEPDNYGIELDRHGWADADTVLEAAQQERTYHISREALAAIVSLDSKGRYEVNGNKIRAAYGHNEDLDVTIENGDSSDIPETLYHGTPIADARSILDEGLKPMSRQEVHLTDSVDEAVGVGERHADDVVVLAVDTESVADAGHTISERGDGVYTTDYVPPEHISRSEV